MPVKKYRRNTRIRKFASQQNKLFKQGTSIYAYDIVVWMPGNRLFSRSRRLLINYTWGKVILQSRDLADTTSTRWSNLASSNNEICRHYILPSVMQLEAQNKKINLNLLTKKLSDKSSLWYISQQELANFLYSPIL